MESRENSLTLARVLSQYRSLSLLGIIVVGSIVMSIFFPNTFFSFDNFSVILLNMSADGTALVATVLILMMGEIDLSIGAGMVLGGTLCGRFMIVNHWPVWLAILVTLLISLLIGFFNGIIVAKVGVISFIGTIATGMIYKGIAIILAGAGWTNFPDKIFQSLGQGKLFGIIHLPIVYIAGIVAIFAVLTQRTRYFRQVYFIGSNLKAAVLSGININRTKIVMFMCSAFLASLGGIISAMRFNSALISIGSQIEMRTIAAAVIGGVSFMGGKGTMVGAALGAIFIAFISNVLSILRVSPDLQIVATGLILVLAVVADNSIAKRVQKEG